MRIDIDSCRGHLEIKDVGWLATVKEYILVAEAEGMTDHFVSDRTPVDIAILQVRLAARECWQGQPAHEPHARGFMLQVQRIIDKRGTTKPREAAFL